MPLEPYERNGVWWVRGRIEYNGRAISAYLRRSTGSLTESGAKDWIRATEEAAIRRHILGAEASLTFDEAIQLYDAKPAEAKYLLAILPHLTGKLLTEITPRMVRDLGEVIYPDNATDTWHRQIITPVSAVINNAHDLGKGPAIRIKTYSARQRIEQDERRGKLSRQPKVAADTQWVVSFMAHADPHNAALARFMFETGVRIGQAIEIRTRHVDLQGRRVRVKASKGHAEQWVAISHEMMILLANLPPRRPKNRKEGGRLMAPRVFGYATRGGMLKAWKSICSNAGIPYLPPHQAGRHGFYTELRVRQGVDPITAAAAGRWSAPSLPDNTYAHSEAAEATLREQISTKLVQAKRAK